MGFSGWAVKKALNSHPQMRRLGFVEAVEIDTGRREATLEITLAGDFAPTAFTATYRVEPETFVIEAVRAERLWMQAVLDYWFASGHKIELPLRSPLIGNALQLFL